MNRRYRKSLLRGLPAFVLLALLVLWVTSLLMKDKDVQQTKNGRADYNMADDKMALGINARNSYQNASPKLLSKSPPLTLDPAIVSNGVSIATMTNSLVKWIKRRDGKEVRVIDAQTIRTLDGKPAMLNVIVTTRTGDLIKVDQLKVLLADNQKNLDGIRKLMREAYKKEDIRTVNAAAGELTKARDNFMKGLETDTYRLSLSKDDPPVVAYWPGLPVEVLKEGVAFTKASSVLGDNIQLTGLLAYTPMSSLLCFKNAEGNTAYVDPINMTLVAKKQLISRSPRRTRQGDDRNERVAKQWQTFLQ